MKLHLLGVNGPFPESSGATSGYLLEAGEALFQFDLGSGVLGRLTALTAPCRSMPLRTWIRPSSGWFLPPPASI